MLTMTAAQIREALEFVNPDGIEAKRAKSSRKLSLLFFLQGY